MSLFLLCGGGTGDLRKACEFPLSSSVAETQRSRKTSPYDPSREINTERNVQQEQKYQSRETPAGTVEASRLMSEEQRILVQSEGC